ncbi:hypothetical protein A7U60_g788 [Sanghuangporus baumii]|uniref:Protein kinase domain-containing protein n=1 Tax=Sanghuangporus baumii TaxID=108892 RepID=A0A9Q5N9S8_SANBA|nr:hypothetical protein A7U60_g788 [Sanghuangporus baumii]
MPGKAPRSSKNRPKNGISYDLMRSEIVWRDRQKMLEQHGYLLRPRFRPGWEPSWLKTNKDPLLCEDSLFNPVPKLIDAIRISDGMKVVIKAVRRDSTETSIGIFLSSPDLAKDPRNHCVPILDVIRDESAPNLEFLVMPLLRPFNKPPFFSVDEMLDFMKQVLEGLVFMHSVGVAHRDCSDMNIMFDGAGMYPNGFHASVWNLDERGIPTYPRRRRDVQSVRYYFTDFGLSSRFLDGEPHVVTGMSGLDKEVPELQLPLNRYDPFPVDVFILGNVFKNNFTAKFSNASFLIPVVESMTQKKASERPSSAEALAHFERLVSSVPGYKRRWRLKETGKGRLGSFIQDVGSLGRECYYILGSLLRSARRSESE